jgi:isopentenyl phosphate kinase
MTEPDTTARGTTAVNLTYLIYDSTLETDVQEFLSDFEIRHFTLWAGVHGAGSHSEPRMDSHTWPGTNHVMAVLGDQTIEDHLYTLVAHIRQKTPGVGIKAITVPVLRHS